MKTTQAGFLVRPPPSTRRLPGLRRAPGRALLVEPGHGHIGGIQRRHGAGGRRRDHARRAGRTREGPPGPPAAGGVRDPQPGPRPDDRRAPPGEGSAARAASRKTTSSRQRSRSRCRPRRRPRSTRSTSSTRPARHHDRGEVRPEIERIAPRAEPRAARARRSASSCASKAQVTVAPGAAARPESRCPPARRALGPDERAGHDRRVLRLPVPVLPRAQETVVTRCSQRYRGKVRFVHRDFLLGRPRSLAAARAARCAGEQGKFWEYRHDLLSTPGDLERRRTSRRARPSLGLRRRATSRPASPPTATTRRSSPPPRTAQKLGVTGTPTFFINGRRMTGARAERAVRRDHRQAELRRGAS